MSYRLTSRSVWQGTLMAGLAATVVSACDSAEMKVPAGTGGSSGSGGKVGGLDATIAAADASPADGAPGRADLPGGVGGVVIATGGTSGTGTGGSTTWALGGVRGTGGGMGGFSDLDAAVPPPTGGTGGARDAGTGGAGGSGGSSDGPTMDGPAGTGGTTADPCNPPAASGYHTLHFRYLWAGQRTYTLFPKLELMPKSVELQVTSFSDTLTCSREQDRPWFNCPVPDSYFVSGAGWRVLDMVHNPELTTIKPWPMPTTAKDYWLRWHYGRPDVPRDKDPPNFEALDYYPDAAHGDWSAMGQWNDAMCVPKPPAAPVTVGFDQGGWFPYKRTSYQYPYGASLAYLYPDLAKAQGALDAFVFDRYNLWKKNWIKYDDDACGAGTARVRSDIPEGTVSEGQGYGIAMSAAIGDKELFDQLWSFVRHYRTPAKYCGLMGWIWQDTADCQPLDAFGPSQDSAFDGDVDIGIGLVYAAMQWPEYTDAATDWLVRMECEVNTRYGDGYNYPTVGDSWDKTNCDANKCDFAEKTSNTLYMDYYPPGYFRVFGDFLAAKLGSDAKAGNGQTHREFWYKTAETVWELVERCYDQSGVHPGLMGNQGSVTQPCSSGGGVPYEWGRALWRLAIDAAWFGDDTSLPENALSSSQHFPGKSRMQAKMDNIQDFYASFYKNNPPEPNANRFSSICHQLGTDGAVKNCDPAYGHNSYTVNMALCPFVTLFDDGGKTTGDIRREALEEALTTTLMNEHYFEESLGVYSILFLTGNFPNPMTVPTTPAP